MSQSVPTVRPTEVPTEAPTAKEEEENRKRKRIKTMSTLVMKKLKGNRSFLDKLVEDYWEIIAKETEKAMNGGKKKGGC